MEPVMTSEGQFLNALAKIFASTDPSLTVGIGDDAAVVTQPQAHMTLSSDMAVEGTHFNRAWSSLYEIGGKVAVANLADVYAMGARARYLLVAAAIPETMTVDEISELARGIRDEADKVGAIVVGGDLTRSPLLTISISVTGEVDSPYLRSGARVGDIVAVSKLPGASSRGLDDLRAGRVSDDVKAHCYPTVDYAKVEALDRSTVHSLTDVSDGLIAELEAIATASRVGIDLTSSFLPNDRHVLHGGEDHVFVGTFAKLPVGWIEIGKVTAGSGVRFDGSEISHEGFTHF